MKTTEYLKGEITELEHKKHMTDLIGMVLTVIVLIYTGLGLWYVQVLTDPEKMTNVIINRFSDQAPKVIARAEMNMIEHAPEVANGVSKNIQQAIPEFRMKLQVILGKLIDDKFAKLEKGMLEISDSYFTAHAALFVPRTKNESIKDYGTRIANVLADQFGKDLDAQLKASTGHDIYELNTNSKIVLEKFESHMERLAKKEFKNLSHEDQLERLLVAHVINKYLQDIPRK